MILATCDACGDEHRLGERTLNGNHLTTTCPECGSPHYSTHVEGEPIELSVEERIEKEAAEATGVGEKNLQNILDEFDTYVGFANASEDELADIDGIGSRTASKIKREVTG